MVYFYQSFVYNSVKLLSIWYKYFLILNNNGMFTIMSFNILTH